MIFNIKGTYYYVEFSDDEELFDGCDGFCEPNDSRIYICNSIDDLRKRQVLIHELIHATLSEVGVYLDNEKLEDVICESVATMIESNFLWIQEAFEKR